MILSFEQFKLQIENPTVSIVKVNDNLQAKTCDVDIELHTASASLGVTLSGFTYEDTWEDRHIESWVAVKLKEYEV